jgi:uncharacterized OB-fold protein
MSILNFLQKPAQAFGTNEKMSQNTYILEAEIMGKKCENCGKEVEGYRDNTNVCEDCMIEILTDTEIQERYNWF